MSDAGLGSSGNKPDDFDVAVDTDGGSAVIRVAGEMDVAASDRWDSLVAATLADEPKSVTVDLALVTFIDSSGLRLLMGLRQLTKDSGIAMSIVNISELTRRVMTVSGVAEYLDV